MLWTGQTGKNKQPPELGVKPCGRVTSGEPAIRCCRSFTLTSRRSGRTSATARDEIRDLLFWRPAAVNANILEYAWRLQDRYSISFWDALIVAAAKSLACPYLLTEDLQTGQDLDGVKVISPFKTGPEILSAE